MFGSQQNLRIYEYNWIRKCLHHSVQKEFWTHFYRQPPYMTMPPSFRSSGVTLSYVLCSIRKCYQKLLLKSEHKNKNNVTWLAFLSRFSDKSLKITFLLNSSVLMKQLFSKHICSTIIRRKFVYFLLVDLQSWWRKCWRPKNFA